MDLRQIINGCSSQPRIAEGEPSMSLQAFARVPSLEGSELYLGGAQRRGHGLDDRLAEFFTRAETPNRRQYTDTEIHQIQNLLGYKSRSWGRVPRMYIVLRLAGHLDLLDSLIGLGFTDHWFPVTAQIFPDTLSPTAIANILNAQPLVLTKSSALEKGKDGQHACFGPGEDLPFERKAFLGRGGSGFVEKVLSRISHKEYALKRIHRQTYFKGAANSMEQCVRELEVLKRLEHRHIVDFVGSYTDPEFIGLLMSPVAECNLADYFNLIPNSKDHESLLRSFFGCLATALKYIHESRVRHKDIKPQNILIKAGNVLLTDFGLARDSLEATYSISDGPSGFSARYCAPEVAAFETRDSSSDIWSLGCVYLEMVSVLKGWTVTDMQNYLKEHGSRSSYIRSNKSGTLQLIAVLRYIGGPHDTLPLDWIETMLAVDSVVRPTARALASRVESANHSLDAKMTFCGICCVTEHGLMTPESDSLMTGMDEDENPSLSLDIHSVEKRTTRRKVAGPNRTRVNSSAAETRSTSGASRSKGQLRPTLPPRTPSGPVTTDVAKTRGGSVTKDKPRASSLFRAVKEGRSGLVQQLLHAGADPNSKDALGATPLHYVANDGQIEIAENLQRCGADLEASDTKGRTALSRAAMHGNLQMVSWLLHRGVQPDTKDFKGNSPLSRAAEYGELEVVRLLLGRPDVEADSIDQDGGTPLSWAAGSGQWDVVKLLLEHEVQIDRKDTRWGRTPVSWAAGAGHVIVVEVLQNTGKVDLNSTDNLRRTPLSYAAENGQAGVVSLLLKQPGIDRHRKDVTGLTALSYAKTFKRKAVITLLSEVNLGAS